MRGPTALPVEHEGSTAVTQPVFLRASAGRAVHCLHPTPRVGSKERDHHRQLGRHHTGEVSRLL